MTAMPALETERLRIRPFEMDDLERIHQILDIELAGADFGADAAGSRRSEEARAEWLRWSGLSYQQLASLNQPPYGDRAVILKSSGELIGAVGLVPGLGPFEQLPGFSMQLSPQFPARFTPEVGLFYALSPEFQGQGYARESASILVEYAFQALHLKRVVATTTFDNRASIEVMRKLGMRILRNPHPDPEWFQVVGVMEAD